MVFKVLGIQHTSKYVFFPKVQRPWNFGGNIIYDMII